MTSQKQSQVTNEILHGNLVKLMFKLSTPGILGMMLISSSTFVDALFAGQLIGETAIAGISLASPLSSIIGGFALLVGVGSASVLSRAMGSGDIKIQSQVFGNLIVMSVVISFVITLVGYSFGEELIVFMGGRGEVVSAGADFFKTYILGSVFLILAIASSQLIKAEGKIRLASIFASIFVFINILLNFIFVSIFHWGIQGLALATVMAMIVYSIVNLTYFLCGKSSLPINPKKLVLAKELLPDILSVGISALLMPVLGSIQNFIVLKSISHYGTQNDIAFFGATEVLISVALIILNGFVQALQPVIGINYGARNYERLKKAYLTFVIGGTVLLTLLWIPLQVYPEIFLGWLLPDVTFTNNDLFNFRIITLSIPILPFAFSGITLFQSTGKGKTITIIIFLRNLILFAPIVVILSMSMGVKGIYYAVFITDILVVLFILLLNIKEFKDLSQMPIEKHQL